MRSLVFSILLVAHLASVFFFDSANTRTVVPLSSQPFSTSEDAGASSSKNALLSHPYHAQAQVGDTVSFAVYLRERLADNSTLTVTFACATSPCHTFSFDQLPAEIELKPENDYRFELNVTTEKAGHDDILFNVTSGASSLDLESAYVALKVARGNGWTIAGLVFGWLYFVSWSVSFWPQNITNFRRKSVVGLSFDYTILHFTGFLFYSTFNIGLFLFDEIHREYEAKYPRSEIPVELNDVVYSLHAALATSITWTQCFIYEHGDQRVSWPGRLFQCAIWLVGAILLVLSFVHVVTWLNFLYYFSYVKLVITSLKYAPQVYFNYVRKSTAGWTIHMIYLDMVGGSTSMLQMLINAHNYNDWITLVGNLPKLGLAIASMSYDVVFLLQEFVFYPNSIDKLPPQRRLSSFTVGPGFEALEAEARLRKKSSIVAGLSNGGSISSNGRIKVTNTNSTDSHNHLVTADALNHDRTQSQTSKI